MPIHRRERQRKNRSKGRVEVKLDSQNAFGYKDQTPKVAVNNIRYKQKRSV